MSLTKSLWSWVGFGFKVLSCMTYWEMHALGYDVTFISLIYQTQQNITLTEKEVQIFKRNKSLTMLLFFIFFSDSW